jgi:hypothetical protein
MQPKTLGTKRSPANKGNEQGNQNFQAPDIGLVTPAQEIADEQSNVSGDTRHVGRTARA